MTPHETAEQRNQLMRYPVTYAAALFGVAVTRDWLGPEASAVIVLAIAGCAYWLFGHIVRCDDALIRQSRISDLWRTPHAMA